MCDYDSHHCTRTYTHIHNSRCQACNDAVLYKLSCDVHRLAELLEGNMPGFSLAATRYDEDARKAGCARRVVGKRVTFMSGRKHVIHVPEVFLVVPCSTATVILSWVNLLLWCLGPNMFALVNIITVVTPCSSSVHTLDAPVHLLLFIVILSLLF